MPHVFSLIAFVLPILAQVPDKVDALQTVAERSDYRATARYDDVDGVVSRVREKNAQRPSHRAGPLVGRAFDPADDRGRPSREDGR